MTIFSRRFASPPRPKQNCLRYSSSPFRLALQPCQQCLRVSFEVSSWGLRCPLASVLRKFFELRLKSHHLVESVSGVLFFGVSGDISADDRKGSSRYVGVGIRTSSSCVLSTEKRVYLAQVVFVIKVSFSCVNVRATFAHPAFSSQFCVNTRRFMWTAFWPRAGPPFTFLRASCEAAATFRLHHIPEQLPLVGKWQTDYVCPLPAKPSTVNGTRLSYGSITETELGTSLSPDVTKWSCESLFATQFALWIGVSRRWDCTIHRLKFEYFAFGLAV